MKLDHQEHACCDGRQEEREEAVAARDRAEIIEGPGEGYHAEKARHQAHEIGGEGGVGAQDGFIGEPSRGALEGEAISKRAHREQHQNEEPAAAKVFLRHAVASDVDHLDVNHAPDTQHPEILEGVYPTVVGETDEQEE